jgi:competence protein ComEC
LAVVALSQKYNAELAEAAETACSACSAVSALSVSAAAARTLDMYFIDVEGGQSTLLVTPAGESLLVDTGYSGNGDRDANRILAAARAAGVTKIDHLLITHFHTDHDGGVVALAAKMPIRRFYDHGSLPFDDPDAVADTRWPPYVDALNAYIPIRAKGKHIEPKPGQRLRLKGVDVTWVSSLRATIVKPVAGAGQPNAACPPVAPPAQEKFENPRSTGFHLRFGKFLFVDLGDLSGEPMYKLICPKNLLGEVDLYLVPHHGGPDLAYPATLAAFHPRAALVNNGVTKGGSVETFAALEAVPNLDVWQLHRSGIPGAKNTADDRIANLDESTGYWIKMSASPDGSFVLTNGRTGVSKSYPPVP